MKKAGENFDRVIVAFAVLTGVIVIFMMLAVTAQVIARKVMGGGLAWVTEIVEYCLLWVTFMATTWVLKKEGHVSIDLVTSRLNPKRLSGLNVVTSIIGAIVCLIVTLYGFIVVWQHYQSGFTLPRVLSPPSYLILMIIPIGMLLLVIQFCRRAGANLQIFRSTSKHRRAQKPSK